MTDDEKMEHLMKQHAAKKVAGASEAKPMQDVANAWELDDRDAPLVCPQCRVTRIGKVPKAWWRLAESRGEDDPPCWKLLCDVCAEAEEEGAKAKKEPAPKVSENLDIEFPNIEEGVE